MAGIARALDVAAQQQGESRRAAIVDAARHAFVDGWAASIWVGAAVMAALLVFLLLRLRAATPRER